MKHPPMLLNKDRGIVICYLEESEEFVCDPSMTHTICIGSTRSGKSQTIVLPTIEQISRYPIPSYQSLFKALKVDLPQTPQGNPNFKQLHEGCFEKKYAGHSVLYDAIYCQQSLVINDVKGELFANSYDMLQERGYQVRVINLERPELSHRYNPLERIKQQFLEDKKKAKQANSKKINWSETTNLVKQLAQILHDDPQSKNQHFPATARGLTTGMILGMVEYLLNQEEEQTFSSQFGTAWEKFLKDNDLDANDLTFADAFTPHTLLNLFVNFSQMQETTEQFDARTGEFVELPTGRSYLELFFDELPKFHVARNEAVSFLSAKGEEKGSILSTTANGLNIFADTSIADMTSFHEFNFEDLITQPTAYFIIVPDDDTTRWRLATIFAEQCYQQLSNLSKNKYGGDSPRRINFLLDEFAQMPPLSNIDMKTSMSGGRNIRWLLFMQSFAQIDVKYPQFFKKIIQDNCSRLIYIKSNDPDTLDYVLKELGTRTVVRRSISHERGSMKQNVTHSIEEEPLMHRDELREMKFEHGIVLTIGEKPIKAKYLAAFRYFHYKDDTGKWVRGIRKTELDKISLDRVTRPFELDHVLGLADPHFWKYSWIDKENQSMTTGETETILVDLDINNDAEEIQENVMTDVIDDLYGYDEDDIF